MMSRRRPILRARVRSCLILVGGAGLLSLALVWCGNGLIRLLENDEPSVSRGTPSSGSLENGKRLPSGGRNYRAYSRTGALLGRNTVHHAVRDTVVDAYQSLEDAGQQHRWIYGETGWRGGGHFPPHRTHQNGMSVDFMVPVLDPHGEPGRLPTWPHTRFGYDLDFDEKGVCGDLSIDFNAVARHLDALSVGAEAHGLRIDRVIIATDYLDEVRGCLGKDRKVPFMEHEAWVRHDEHYHVDFMLAR